MELADVPYFSIMHVEERPLPLRVVDLIYNPHGPCDHCGEAEEGESETCLLHFRRLCERCRDNW